MQNTFVCSCSQDRTEHTLLCSVWEACGTSSIQSSRISTVRLHLGHNSCIQEALSEIRLSFTNYRLTENFNTSEVDIFSEYSQLLQFFDRVVFMEIDGQCVVMNYSAVDGRKIMPNILG